MIFYTLFNGRDQNSQKNVFLKKMQPWSTCTLLPIKHNNPQSWFFPKMNYSSHRHISRPIKLRFFFFIKMRFFLWFLVRNFQGLWYDSYFSVFRELRLALKHSMFLLKNDCTTTRMRLENGSEKLSYGSHKLMLASSR